MKAIMRVPRELFGTYADAARAVWALRVLFAGLIAWEFAQHAMEIRLGMFESKTAFRALSAAPERMALGWVKMGLVYAGGFFVIRHLSAARLGRRLDPLAPAARRYAPYVAYALAVFAAIFYAPAFAGAHADTVRMIAGLGQLLAEPLLFVWLVAAASDGTVRGPLASARATGVLYVVALPLYLACRVPAGLAHSHLHTLALGQEATAVWALMALDSLVVGAIIALPAAAAVRVTGWAADRAARRTAALATTKMQRA